MEEEQNDMNSVPDGCGFQWCSNNTCGLGGVKSIEYCYDIFGYIISTRCGCQGY